MTEAQLEPNLNRCLLAGRIANEPKLRQTNSGPICNFTLEALSRFQGSDGQWRSTSEFAHVVVWGRLGEVIAAKPVGERLFVEGRLQTRAWDDPTTGEKRSMVEVVADGVRFLEERNSDRPAREQPAARGVDPGDIPF
jgi:single-strand DNA-binding protein